MADPHTRAAVVTLCGSLTIRTVDDTRAQLLDALSRSPVLRVDLTTVQEADVSLIELLLAARRSAAEAGGMLRLSAPAQGPLLAALLRGGFVPPDLRARGPADAFWLLPEDGA